MLRTFARFSWIIVVFITACEQNDGVVPDITLQADQQTVEYNGTFVMTWSAEGTDYCIASGDWVGNLKRSGSKTLGPLTRDSRYVLDCYDSGEKISQLVTIKVDEPRIPEVRIAASPLNIAYNGETTVTWSTQHVSECNARGDWSGNRSPNGSIRLTELKADSEFILVCQGNHGEVSHSVSVEVFEPGIHVPLVTLTATPLKAPYNGSTTLSWDSTGADICRAWGDWSGSKGRSGSEIIRQLSKDSRFILICTQAGGFGVEGRDAIEVTIQERSAESR